MTRTPVITPACASCPKTGRSPGAAEVRAEIFVVSGAIDQNRTPTPTTASVSFARTTFIWP